MPLATQVVVVGASAGGVQALTELSRALPPDLDAAVCVVLHLASGLESTLDLVLDRVCALPVSMARDGEALLTGHVYVARPDCHFWIEQDVVRLGYGPKVDHHRPSVDTLFHSAAAAYGERATGVVLTGYMSDGSAGLESIQSHGGCTLVQHPDDARHEAMPLNALWEVDADAMLPLEELPAAIVAAVAARRPVLPVNADFVESFSPAYGVMTFAVLPDFKCPTCGGVVLELSKGALRRYRCRSGHPCNPDAAKPRD